MSDTDPVLQVRPTLAGLAGAVGLTDLENLTDTGIIVQATNNDFVARTMVEPAAGIEIVNPAGIGGNPTFSLADDLAAVEGLSGTGLAARTAADTWTTRSVAGTTNRVTVTNGDGVAGNPTVDIASNYAGQNTITTVGTVANGTWNGTAVGVGYGGTGLTATPTNGQVPIGNGSGYTLATLTAGAGVSITNGTGTITVAASNVNSSKNLLINPGMDIFQRGQISGNSSLNGTYTSGSATVSSIATSGLSVGMGIYASGCTPAGTTITAINSSTSLTMSANSTASLSSVPTYFGALDNRFVGADRWLALIDSSDYTIGMTKVSATGLNASSALRLDRYTSATASRWGIGQWLESRRSIGARGKTLTFSAKINKNGSTATVRCAILEWQGTADTLSTSRDPVNNWSSGTFTTGNFFKSTSFAVVATGSVSPAASGYTTISCTGTVSTSANNLFVMIWNDDQANGQLDVTECDLHEGSSVRVWTPPEEAIDTAECERFFYKTFAIGQQPVVNIGNNQGVEQIYPASSSRGGTTTRFRQRMFRAPSPTEVVIYNPSASETESIRDVTNSANRTASKGTPTDTGVTVEILSSVSDGSRNTFHLTADAEIQ